MVDHKFWICLVNQSINFLKDKISYVWDVKVYNICSLVNNDNEKKLT